MKSLRIAVLGAEGASALDLQQRVERLGYSVAAVVPADEKALDELQRIRPDVVLMDVRPQGPMDGAQAFTRIHERLDAPVVCLGVPFGADNAEVTGPFGYLVKPFENAELNAAIQVAVYRHRMEKEIQAYNDKLRVLASRLSLAEERQRRRLAIDVHDRIGQNLALAKIQLSLLYTSVDSERTTEKVEEIMRIVDEAIRDTRSLISELGSPALHELGFVESVQWLARQMEARHGVVFTVEDDGRPKPMIDDIRDLLFQAVRELLVNVIKHAGAGAGKVSIAREGDKVRVEVLDDGVGFVKGKAAAGTDMFGGFGLFSIHERLKPVGGTLKIESQPGGGTRAEVFAPLAAVTERTKAVCA